MKPSCTDCRMLWLRASARRSASYERARSSACAHSRPMVSRKVAASSSKVRAPR
ncbi:MAG TPA: hypothetical protein VJT67_05285 [Longimicrobiaceae bacterium]|nr:hypothetical protein [Longimicrobiaceae bacterium]